MSKQIIMITNLPFIAKSKKWINMQLSRGMFRHNDRYVFTDGKYTYFRTPENIIDEYYDSRKIREFTGHTRTIYFITVVDGLMISAGGFMETELIVRKLDDGKVIYSRDNLNHANVITYFGGFIYTGSSEGGIILRINFRKNEIRQIHSTGSIYTIENIYFRDNEIIVINHDGQIDILDIQTHEVLRKYDVCMLECSYLHGDVLYFRSSKGLYLIDINTGKYDRLCDSIPKESTQLIHYRDYSFVTNSNNLIMIDSSSKRELATDVQEMKLIGDELYIVRSDGISIISLLPQLDIGAHFRQLSDGQRKIMIFLATILFGAGLNKNVIRDILCEL